MKQALVCAGVVVLVACSATGGESSSETVAIGEQVEPLSNAEQCDSAPANEVINDIGGTVTDRLYSSAACHNAYLINANALGNPRVGTVYWADDRPTTQDLCTHAEVWSYVWEASAAGGQPEDDEAIFLGGKKTGGIWTGGRCLLSSLEYRCPVYFSSNRAYRFAIAARQVSANGSYARRKVGFSLLPGGIGAGGVGGTAGACPGGAGGIGGSP